MSRAWRGDGYLPPSSSFEDSDSSPPWHSAQLQPLESAMRSTLSAVNSQREYEMLTHLQQTPPTPKATSPVTAPSATIHPSNLMVSPVLFAPLPLIPLRKCPIDSDTYHIRHGRDIPNFEVEMYEPDTVEVIENGRAMLKVDEWELDMDSDCMYHIGHVRGETYSGRLRGDDPDQIPDKAAQYIKDMHDKRLKPLRLQESIKLLKETTKLVRSGAILMVERASFIDCGETVPCYRPGCTNLRGIPGGHYYLQLDCGDNEYTYCLRCFEMLWKGDCTEQRVGTDLDDHLQSRRDSVVEMAVEQYDSTVDEPLPGLAQSRWAVSHEQHESTFDPLATPERQLTTPEETQESPDSIMSDTHEWRYPPTPLQRIAASFQPGNTLSCTDEAAVMLWKAASRVQLEWEQHLHKTKCARDYYNGVAEHDQSMNLMPVRPEADENIDEEALEAETGLRKKDCYGNDLSEILAKVAKQKD